VLDAVPLMMEYADPAPDIFVRFDDVFATGSHFKGREIVLGEHFPDGLRPFSCARRAATTLFVLNKLMSPSRSTPASVPAATQPAVPPNPAHERAALEEELKRKPGHPPILLRLAEMEREAGKPSGAVPYLRQILDQDSKNEEARLELGRTLYDSGDIEGALKETKQLLADHPNQVDGLYNLGAIYANQNRFDLAREYWSKAVASDPLSDSGSRAKDWYGEVGQIAQRETRIHRQL
jgi:tetratricopeptide (TPR) repeat protein